MGRVTLFSTLLNFAGGFDTPVLLPGRGDSSGKVLVVQKGGLVRILDPKAGTIDATPVLDVTSQVATDGERGLLGPGSGARFRLVYICMTAQNGGIQIRKFAATTPGATGNGDIIFSTPMACWSSVPVMVAAVANRKFGTMVCAIPSATASTRRPASSISAMSDGAPGKRSTWHTG